MLYGREVKEYYHAKREAARRLGTVHLPSNWEVHEQLLFIARKVDGDEHLRRLTEMRRRALALMELLKPYSPRLIGSVLTGHIRKGSDIDLHAYTEDVDALCRTLEAAGHEYVVEVVTTRKYGEPMEFTHVRLPDLGGFEVEITLYPVESLRIQPRCGITGKAMRRATAAELRQILDEPPPAATAGPPVWTPPFAEETIHRHLPELAACRGVLQNHYHHLDVHGHTWAVVSGLEQMATSGYDRFASHAPDLRKHLENPTLLYLAGFCHDLGKPATQSFARDGRIRFIGHEHVGADVARGIGPRLGLDAAATEDLARLVECHLEAVRIPAEGGDPSRIRRVLSRVGERLPELVLLSVADVEAARGPAQNAARLEDQEQFAQFLLEQFFTGGFLTNPILPVSADDLTEALGPLSARTMARLRESLLDAFVDGEFEGREEGLELASELIARARSER